MIGGFVKIEWELKAVTYIAISNIPLSWTQGCKGAQFLSRKAWQHLEPRSGTSIPGCMLVSSKWLCVTIAWTWSSQDRAKKMRITLKIVKYNKKKFVTLSYLRWLWFFITHPLISVRFFWLLYVTWWEFFIRVISCPTIISFLKRHSNWKKASSRVSLFRLSYFTYLEENPTSFCRVQWYEKDDFKVLSHQILIYRLRNETNIDFSFGREIARTRVHLEVYCLKVFSSCFGNNIVTPAETLKSLKTTDQNINSYQKSRNACAVHTI